MGKLTTFSSLQIYSYSNRKGAIAVAECLADNPVLIRVDLRDNPDIKLAGLLALHLTLKLNTSMTTLNLDKSCIQGPHSKVRKYFV